MARAAASLKLREDKTICRALRILNARLRLPGVALSHPDMVSAWLQLNLADKDREIFCILFLDNQHRLISSEEITQGTIDSATVYPREVVKRVMAYNAAAVILAHNHPSGMTEPSEADRLLTHRLKAALNMVDVRVLDHFIIGGARNAPVLSFAQRGLL